ncbi:uncharacterized protein LOC129875700 [Solanum dulcamara]|uniref:uncharacterized protein LOC129875700 n=1 Tax=Solanum dulcamara TaxID=45834 RepID=UPI002485EBDD|nr:uncharacterized protein LOC129875700 [Solanum dulcamara]
MYPIADSKWVSPVQCVPKKGGRTIVPNEKNELVLMRPVTGWRVCKDECLHGERSFPYVVHGPNMDHLVGRGWYFFLDGYSEYNQISIAPEDQDKTTFTFPYGTFAFRRMPF